MLQIGAAVLAGVVGGLWIGHQPPFQLSQGLIGFSFLYGGYFLKKKKWLFWRLRFWEGTLMGVGWFLTAIIGTMDLGMYEVRGGFVSVLGSFLGAALLIRLFLHLDFLETLWAEGLRTIGRYTMWILCVHGIEGAVIPWNFLFRFVEKDTWMGCVCWFFLRLIVIGACCVALEQWKHMCMKQILRERQGIK